MEHLFVYGTLKYGYKHPMATFLNHHSEFMGRGFLQGKLYLVAHYPGAVPSDNPDDKVHGHVFRLEGDTVEIFKVLDAYEGMDYKTEAPDPYIRTKATIYMEAFGSLEAWVYVYNFPTENLTLIPSGRFIT